MLFNSYTFLVLFLPLTLTGFYTLLKLNNSRWAIGFLTFQSLLFYGWWDVGYVPLLLSSIAVNYAIASRMMRHEGRHKKQLLIIGICFNLGLLGYFKYIGFFTSSLQAIGLDVPLITVALPLAISFFTFQQIAFLLGIYEGSDRLPGVLRYAAFVTFFPHLIAGPILHHKEIQPQFSTLGQKIPWDQLWMGIGLFSLGLFKKVMIADSIAVYSDPLYANAAVISCFEAWMAAFLYGLQIYFDFSGYSDMALGLGHLFGITLPRNFASPFKSTNIIDLWQRWHMTLTRFLFAYVYTPLTLRVIRKRAAKGLSVNNKAMVTLSGFFNIVCCPILITMGVSGLWHGAGMQFIFWGLLHGIYLSVNHAWRSLGYALAPVAGRTLTITSFMVAIVLFRATSVDVAGHIYAAMLHLGPALAHAQPVLQKGDLLRALAWIVAGLSVSLSFPNAVSWVREGETAYGFGFSAGLPCFLMILIIFLIGFTQISSFSPFIYFNF